MLNKDVPRTFQGAWVLFGGMVILGTMEIKLMDKLWYGPAPVLDLLLFMIGIVLVPAFAVLTDLIFEKLSVNRGV